MIKFETFLETLAASNNRLLVSNSKDATQWNKLKHNKACLELFLNHNISEVFFTTNDGTEKRSIASSNTTLIKMFCLKKGSTYENQIKRLSKMKSNGIHTKSSTSVLTWDFIKNDYCTIPLKGIWYLGNWITLSDENIALLNETMKDIIEQTKNKKNKTAKK